jgi:hypothetical protein
MGDKANFSNIGAVVSVRVSIVDIRCEKWLTGFHEAFAERDSLDLNRIKRVQDVHSTQ